MPGTAEHKQNLNTKAPLVAMFALLLGSLWFMCSAERCYAMSSLSLLWLHTHRTAKPVACFGLCSYCCTGTQLHCYTILHSTMWSQALNLHALHQFCASGIRWLLHLLLKFNQNDGVTFCTNTAISMKVWSFRWDWPDVVFSLVSDNKVWQTCSLTKPVNNKATWVAKQLPVFKDFYLTIEGWFPQHFYFDHSCLLGSSSTAHLSRCPMVS